MNTLKAALKLVNQGTAADSDQADLLSGTGDPVLQTPMFDMSAMSASNSPDPILAGANLGLVTPVQTGIFATTSVGSITTVATAGGLVFNNTFTANCTQQYINCVVAAEQTFQSLWGNSLTVNLTFDEQAFGTNTFLAENNFSIVTESYAQLTSALPAGDALTSADPAGGQSWYLPDAYARMLGLSTFTPSTDDTVTLNSSYGWLFGQDVTSEIEHEVSEGVMGRVGGLGDGLNGHWSTMDLFRYSSAGVHDFTDGRDGNTTYFSADGTTLSLGLTFNNEFNSVGTQVNTGDTADFIQPDVYGTGSPGQTTTLSQTDLAIMAALGWKRTGTSIAPTVTGTSFSVAVNQPVALAADIATANPSGDSITSYWAEDLGGGSGHLTAGGVTEADGQWFQVSSQWSNVQYVGGATAGTDTLELAMFDATTGNYVFSPTFTATTTTPATVTGTSFSVAANQPIALAADIATTNPSGDSITSYWAIDLGGGSGSLTAGGVAETDGQWFQVSSQWSNVQYVGGAAAGTDTLELAMFDATTGNYVYSPTFTATMATASDTAQTVTAATSQGGSSNGAAITTGFLGVPNLPDFINADGSGVNMVAATASGQTLTAGGASETLIGFSGFGDTFSGLSADLNGATILLFGGSDVIDLIDLGLGRASTLAYQGASGLGTLTATDGTHTAKIDFVGDYTAANFSLASDTHGGSFVSFVSM